MLTLIIVDDERATREKLLDNIDWSGLRIETVGEAKDGADGVNLFGRTRPDIVLLDIRMPRMNGIECAAEIRKLDATSKIIFLSGYTDKEYLKSAIQMQAIDYIEKPIDLDELHAVLKKTVLLCEEEKLKEAEQQEINARIEQTLVWMKQELAQVMIRGDADPHAVKRQFADVGAAMAIDDCYRCVLLEFGAGSAVTLHKEKLLETLNDTFEIASFPAVAGFLDGTRAAVVLCGKAAENSAVIRKAIESVQQDGSWRDAEESLPVTAGIGKLVRGMEHVPRSFDFARKALHKKFIHGYGSISLEEEDRPTVEMRKAGELNAKLTRWLQEGNLSAARLEIDTLAEYVRKQAEHLQIASIKAELLSIILHLVQLAKEHGLTSGNEWNDRELQWAEHLNQSTLPEAVALIQSKLAALFEQAGEQRGKSRKIRAAMEYIKAHYSEDLSVVILAAHLEMGTSYLSTLFKKETGKTLSEYIEAFRMEKAKALLMDERLKMSEVANSVGYRNANYFTSVFKRAVGQYPSEFRRNPLP